MKDSFIYINTGHALSAFAAKWAKEKVIGVDLECENNLHRYGVYLSLIQISTSKGNYIIDVLALDKKKLEPLVKVLESSKVEVIFHDHSFDFRILGSELNCRPKKLFDTQVAALLLGRENVGLGSLLEEFFNISKEKKFQRADWTRRPLNPDMLSYAIKDTYYLIELKEKLEELLKEKGRLAWAKQEFKYIESKKFEMVKPNFLDMKGVRVLDNKQRAIGFEIYKLREGFAKEVNRPVHFILPNRRLIEIAEKGGLAISEWKKLSKVHPIVKTNANKFYNAVKVGREKKLEMPYIEKKKFDHDQKKLFSEIEEKRNKIGAELGIKGYLIADKLQIRELVLSGLKKTKMQKILRTWQRGLMLAKL